MKLNKFYSTLKNFTKTSETSGSYDVSFLHGKAEIIDMATDRLSVVVGIDDIPEGIDTKVKLEGSAFNDLYAAGTKDFPSFIVRCGESTGREELNSYDTSDLVKADIDSRRFLAFVKAATEFNKQEKELFRSYVHHICLEIKDSLLRMAYTNGKLMITSSFAVPEGFTLPFKQTVIPCAVLPFVQAMVSKAKGNLSLYTTEDRVIFSDSQQTIAYKCKEEHYPDMDKFITSDLVIVDEGFMSCHADTILACDKEADWNPEKNRSKSKRINPPMVRLAQNSEVYYVEKDTGNARRELGSWDNRFEFSCLFNVDLLKPILAYVKDTGESYKLGFKAGSNYSNSGLIFSNQNSFIILMPMRS